MSTINRGLRNIFRKPSRAIGVIVIIGISLGIFLTMSIVADSIYDEAVTVSEGVDTTIIISLAGSGPGSSETMDEVVLEQIEASDASSNIISVQPIAQNRVGSPREGGFILQGQDPSVELATTDGSTITLESGRLLQYPDQNQPVAIIGSNYAETNGVTVGDEVMLEETSVEIVGVFNSESRFAGNSIIAPYQTVITIYNLSGPNQIYVKVDFIGNRDAVAEELRATLGDDIDVVPLTDIQADALQESINNIVGNSELGTWFALITAVTVMIFTMILITRERIKEIGLLKAIGLTNRKIIAQFMVESMGLATMGFVVSLLFALVAGPAIQDYMYGSSSTSAPSGFGGKRQGGTLASTTTNSFEQIDFSLAPELVAFTLVLALFLGIIGSLYPIIKALKLNPADALRYE